MDDNTRRLLLENPALFIVTYFPHRIKKLEPFHVRLIETASSETRSLILFPAGHGKTTLVSTLLPVWEICRNPNIRIAIIAKNTNEGEGIMRAIQSELVDNEELIRDFGPFHAKNDDGKAWSLGRIDVAKRTRRGKEATIAMFGASSKDVLGWRTDWTICDDVVEDVNSHTPESRAKLRNWFDLRVETGPEHIHSRLTVIGTRFHPEDLYGDLIELVAPDDDGKRLENIYAIRDKDKDAIVDNEKHITLWPERWPWKRLMMQKVKVGTLNFNKRYRNIAVDESRLVFREEYVKGGWLGKNQYPGVLDKDFKVGDYADNWRMVAGFDPAIGSSKHAKFCAHVILAEGQCKHHDRCFWVVDCEREQWTLPQQVDKIISKHQEFGLLSSQVEANSYQAGLLEAVDQKMRETDIALAIYPHYTNKQNKPDPETGVRGMGPWFERGAFHIPYGDSFSQNRMRQLVDELVMYPDSRTTDTVMALWFAWRQLQTGMARFGSINRLKKEAPGWDRRLGRRYVKNPAYRQRDAA